MRYCNVGNCAEPALHDSNYCRRHTRTIVRYEVASEPWTPWCKCQEPDKDLVMQTGCLRCHKPVYEWVVAALREKGIVE